MMRSLCSGPSAARVTAEGLFTQAFLSERKGGRSEISAQGGSSGLRCVMMDLTLSSSFTEKTIPNVIISHRYKAQDTPARKTFEQALTGAFMSAVIKDLRPSALPFVASLIRHYTMVAVAQQCGEWGPGSGCVASSGRLKNWVRTWWCFREASLAD